MQAYVHTKVLGHYGMDTLATVSVDVKVALLPWQERGLQFTRTGYGPKIPTPYMVRFNGRWRRVYCCIYSNSGTCYIGKFGGQAESLIVQIEQ
jgi:hypothetical protein